MKHTGVCILSTPYYPVRLPPYYGRQWLGRRSALMNSQEWLQQKSPALHTENWTMMIANELINDPVIYNCMDTVMKHHIIVNILHQQIDKKASSMNSSPPSATYMCQWIGSALVQIMTCCLFHTKPLSKPMLGCCQLDHWDQTSENSESKYKTFHSSKCIWNVISKMAAILSRGDELTQYTRNRIDDIL